MKSSLLFLLLAAVFCSCASTAEVEKFPWKEFKYSEAHFKADFPCDPQIKSQLVQETPKLIRRYTASCKHKEFEFNITLSEWFEDFDRAKIGQYYDDHKAEFRRSLGKNEDVLKFEDTTLPDGSPAMFVEARSGQLMFRELRVANEHGFYDVTVKTSGDPNMPTLNGPAFDAAAKKFSDSFKLIE